VDSRHESLDQEVLNHLICCINNYVKNNLDEIVVNDHLLNEMKIISQYIYGYVQMPLDLEHLFSKKNFLSIDIVFLPLIDEVNNENQHNLRMLIANISSTINGKGSSGFYNDIKKILTGYQP
jgi:hypothetical protein